MSEIFEKNLAGRASKLKIASVVLSENMRSGNFRSINSGQGIEFSDVREYMLGDNVRSIDWNVTARMGRAFIKQYEEDKELNVFCILDCSLSMLSGSNGKSKIRTACDVAALLILAALNNLGASGAIFFDSEIRFSCQPKAGRENAMMILSKLDSLDFSSSVGGSVLASAIKAGAVMLKRRSLVFVISDFRTADYKSELAFLAQKHDVVAIRINDPSDSELPKIGTLPFSDYETHKTMLLPTSSSRFAEEWFEENRKNVGAWNDFCVKHNVFPLPILTNEDAVLVLTNFFASRKRH
ncbi:MAG: DUF58 domain-containing protein [Treponema sp.]|nr:DUF58 domain-containing protein [Treponema sp.]MBR4629129.1 DUF58 domain-containing protein [Treponema sp.]MBR6913854.1 DUF58 domain-containing protein [Treponema sp.]